MGETNCKYDKCVSCGVEKTTRHQKLNRLCRDCSNNSRKETCSTRICSACSIEKPFTDKHFTFRRIDKNNSIVLKGVCKTCDSARRSKHYYANIRNEKSTRLKNDFGIDIQQYEQMLKNQNGVCKICNKPEKHGRNLAVDHCHKSLAIRGLLCASCNTALGKFEDDVERLKNAIAYLTN
jgi:abortive infection bacteriophage resistance protein